MRIGELARRAGLTTETVRFYEKRGLMGEQACVRSEGNYRLYPETAVKRLETIAAAKHLGFTLTEISELGRLWESGKLSPAAGVRALHEKLTELESKSRAIEQLRDVIHAKLEAIAPTQDAQPA